MRRGRFWIRQLQLGRVQLSIVYNTTFSMTDGRIHAYHYGPDAMDESNTFSLRIGHLWLNVDIFR